MNDKDFDLTKKYAPNSLGSVCILGFGKSGRIVLDYCAKLLGSRVDKICVFTGFAENTTHEIKQEYLCKNISFVFDTQQIPKTESFDVCIVSPGISEFDDFYKSAAVVSDELISEVEFAWRESKRDSIWIGVTGTNGKTTTTSLIAHVLAACGMDARAVGNIGYTCLEAVEKDNTSVYVAEVSSYQLASTIRFACDIAVILNITPDHLTWHKTFKNYEEAKFKILNNLCQNKDSLAVLNATDSCVLNRIKHLKALTEEKRGFDYIAIGTADGIFESMINRCGAKNAAYVFRDMLTVELNGKKHQLCAIDDMLIKGEHNIENALAAVSVAVHLNCEDSCIVDAVKTFKPLEHRIEFCGEIDGVMCYNDSKATNVDATLKAYTAFTNKHVVVLLGGRDKNTNLEGLVEETCKNADVVVCFGGSRDRFLDAFKNTRPDELVVLSANNLKEAFQVGLLHASAGGVLLLSPACASFDEFSCFEERGEAFKKLVSDATEA